MNVASPVPHRYPGGHAVRFVGVGQKKPAVHTACVPEPAGHHRPPTLHAIGCAVPPVQ